jgi:peptidoglycan hydrolase CwlO-like protein
MLTKDDLKQIGSIVDTKIDKQLDPVKKDIADLKKDMKTVKRDMGETRNDIKTLRAYFDRDYVNLRKRIDRIEEHLGVPDKN